VVIVTRNIWHFMIDSIWTTFEVVSICFNHSVLFSPLGNISRVIPGTLSKPTGRGAPFVQGLVCTSVGAS
jgi:hypothetical protein